MHLNSHSLPNKLPHELLVMVFKKALPTDAAFSFPGAIEDDGYRPILQGLNVITQVCRLWRNVAFGTPALWTRVHARGYPADQLWILVERSDLLPLSLFLEQACDSTMQESHGILRRISSRLQRIDINITQPTPLAIKELLSFDGSMLRCLTTSYPAFDRQSILNRDGATHSIPILQGQTDALEALAIVPSTGWIPANHFPHLTHLYISFDTSPHPRDILFLLHSTPCLEITHLHHLDRQETPLTGDPSESVPVELPRLRSLVFTVSAYHPVVEILCALSVPPSALIRLDNLFVPYDTQYPDPIPANLSPLAHVTTMDLAVEEQVLFLVMQGPSSGLWLRARHAHNMFWDRWLLDLAHTLSTPLRNLVSLRLDVYMDDEGGPLALLPHAVQLSELSVRFNKFLGLGVLQLVRTVCLALSQSQPPGHGQAVCPSLRSLALEWPRNLPQSADLGISDIVAMLSARSHLGQPIRRLVVQAIAVSLGSIPATVFSEQLSVLAEHVEEYEERVDPDTHACAFEMREMWNVEGVEDYWKVDESLRPEYSLWGHDDLY